MNTTSQQMSVQQLIEQCRLTGPGDIAFTDETGRQRGIERFRPDPDRDDFLMILWTGKHSEPADPDRIVTVDEITSVNEWEG